MPLRQGAGSARPGLRVEVSMRSSWDLISGSLISRRAEDDGVPIPNAGDGHGASIGPGDDRPVALLIEAGMVVAGLPSAIGQGDVVGTTGHDPGFDMGRADW